MTAAKDDYLSRDDEIKHLTKVLEGKTDAFVMSLNSPFGTGKTHFIKAWAQKLKATGHPYVMFDAWKTDFADDALLAFVVELKKTFKDDRAIRGMISQLAQSASALMKNNKEQIITKSLKFIENCNLPIASGLAGASANLVEGINLSDNNSFDDKMQAFEDTQKAITDFKKSLEKIVEKLKETSGKNNVIIFVDELDRCRPPYALQVLEAIKHFFDVDGLVFVIAVDDVQLRSSVQQIYGIREDGEGYLNKFIHLQVTLPPANHEKYVKSVCQSKDWGHLNSFIKDTDYFEHNLSLYSQLFGLSLRQINRSFQELELFPETIPKEHAELVSFVLCMRCKSSTMADNFANNNYLQDIIESFNGNFLHDIKKQIQLRSLPLSETQLEYFLKAIFSQAIEREAMTEGNHEYSHQKSYIQEYLNDMQSIKSVSCSYYKYYYDVLESAGRYLPNYEEYIPAPPLVD